MITSVLASLSIQTDDPGRKVAPVTTALGIEPTRIWEHGDPWPSNGRPDRHRTHGTWTFEEERTIGDAEDPHGMASLVRLVQRFEPKAAVLEELSADYRILVQMFAMSDSRQAGFWIGSETMRRLGLLHAAFVPDVYLDALPTDDLVE